MANIMIVDDSAVMRRVLKSYFAQIGHSVVAEAINGEQALMYYDVFKPDLVTLDITMPGDDGTIILKHLIKKNPELKIIIVSSITKKSTIVESLTNGAKHYILKPFTFEKIVSAVRGVFGECKMDDVIKRAEEEVDFAIEEEKAESVLNITNIDSDPASIFSKSIKMEVTENISLENIDDFKRNLEEIVLVSPKIVTIDLGKIKNIDLDILEKLKRITEEVFNIRKIKFLIIEPV